MSRKPEPAFGGSGTRVAVDSNTVLSGLLFPGPERRLLVYGLAGRIDIIIGEDAVDEVTRVLQDRFQHHPAIADAFEWLGRLLGLCTLVPRPDYEAEEKTLALRLRDPKDVPVLACAIASRADFFVSGDEDLLVLRAVAGMSICRTRDLLATLERK